MALLLRVQKSGDIMKKLPISIQTFHDIRVGGLYLETRWDWETPYPVIFISFGRGNIDSR
jgi:hypothetical protein